MKIDPWGDPHRHYVTPDIGDRTTLLNEQWVHVAHQLPPTSKDAVERTVDLWNQRIRNRLSKEMGFELNGRQIRVQVADGLPHPLAGCIEPDDITTILALNRELLTAVIKGTSFMESVWDRLETELASTASSTEVKRVRETAEEWLRLVDDRGLPSVLRTIREDVLGAYFFEQHTVTVYWLATAIFSALWAVPIEDLTFIVLSHELAHAYSHLGYDIDGHDWPTEWFRSTDVAIVEGLAQFYTEIVCENFQEKLPSVKETFETLVQNQHQIYQEHRRWVNADTTDNGEVIRVCLVECRRSDRSMSPNRFAETVHRRRLEIVG